MDDSLPSRCEELLRQLAPQALVAMQRRYRDPAAAEDAVQEALLAAALHWPQRGIPDNPGGWLLTAASRRMIDHWRAEEARRRAEAGAATEPIARAGEEDSIEQIDETLDLFFRCCHPSLSLMSAIALTLRAVGGLTTLEIARAFLVSEKTIAQRISRAKETLKALEFPIHRPDPNERTQRLCAVLHVLYLLFNEGYTSLTGRHIEGCDVSREAIRLSRLILSLVTNEPEIQGLLALMLLTNARRHARTGVAGELIPLAKQDRTLWDRSEITEGLALLTAALEKGAIGPYQLQACIAALHSEAATSDTTDWPQILLLYELLKRMSDNPIVTLNHAVAAAMVHGAARGLELIEKLDSDRRLAGYYRVHAVRGHLLEMSGHHQAAIREYQIAASKTTSTLERNYLLLQSAQLKDRA